MAETSSQGRDRLADLGRTIYDAAFQSRQFTPGAALQRPRKIPIRVEPKTWFANERTFLAWAGLAVLLGSAATALTSMSGDNSGPIREGTVDGISLALAPAAAVVICYGLFTYLSRTSFLENKQVGFFDDRVGPICMTALIASLLTGITGAAYWDFFH